MFYDFEGGGHSICPAMESEGSPMVKTTNCAPESRLTTSFLGPMRPLKPSVQVTWTACGIEQASWPLLSSRPSLSQLPEIVPQSGNACSASIPDPPDWPTRAWYIVSMKDAIIPLYINVVQWWPTPVVHLFPSSWCGAPCFVLVSDASFGRNCS